VPPNPASGGADLVLSVGAVYVTAGELRAQQAEGVYDWTSKTGDFLGATVLILLAWATIQGTAVGLQRVIPARIRGRSLIVGGVVLSLVVFGVVPLALVIAQFCPHRIGCRRTPADLGAKDFETVTLTSDGLKLSAWYLPGTDRRPVLIVHGIGANKDNFLEPAVKLREAGHPVLTLDLRAHGDSEGRICSAGYHEVADVMAGLRWLQSRHPGRKPGVLAYSMGAAAAIRAAERGDVPRLVVDSTFARAETVARTAVLRRFGPLETPFWHVGRFWSWLVTGVDLAQHNPQESLRKANVNVLIIHGQLDPMIPASEAERLKSAAGSRGALWIIRNAGHVETSLHPNYIARVGEFLDEPDVTD
jgi:pimeloyl-ACP methyl ester carboxylesterase